MLKLWCGDIDTALGRLYLITDEALYLSSPDDKDVPAIRERLENGENPVSVLTGGTDVIPLPSISKITTDKHDDDIEITYLHGSENKTRTIWLANQEKRDEVFAALKATYANRFQETEDIYTMPRAVYGSLLALTIFGGLTWGGAKAAIVFREAGDYEISGSRQGLKALIAWILELLGPTGVSIIGGIFCLMSAMVLYKRIKEPPMMLVLQEGPHKTGSSIGFVFKYGLMFGAWYLAYLMITR